MRLRLVMLMVIAPLFGLTSYFVVNKALELRATASASHIATIVSAEGTTVGAVVHEMQKERGYSAGFIASNGGSFADNLRQQRLDTVAAVARYRAEVSLLAGDNSELASELSDRFAALETVRGDVDAFSLSVGEMAAFYTGTINLLLELAYPEAGQSAQDQLRAIASARAFVASAKESAGLERAMGAAGLTGGFSAPIIDRFIGLKGAQHALLSQSNSILRRPGWVEQLYETPEYQAITDARLIIRDGVETGDFSAISGPEWFAISTDWIDLLRQTEVDLFGDATTVAMLVEEQAKKTYWTLVLFGTSATIAVVAFERIINRINVLVKTIDGLRQADWTFRLTGLMAKMS